MACFAQAPAPPGITTSGGILIDSSHEAVAALVNEGLEEMEAIEMVAASLEEAAVEDTGVSVVILPMTGSFDARIFSEEL